MACFESMAALLSLEYSEVLSVDYAVTLSASLGLLVCGSNNMYQREEKKVSKFAVMSQSISPHDREGENRMEWL